MRQVRLLLAVAPGLAGFVLAGAIGGCFKADVDTRGWQDVAREYKGAYAPSSSERDQAVASAREAALEAGLTRRQLDDCSVSTDAEGKVWWVTFRSRVAKGDTWPAKFVVRVESGGRTKLYKDPADAPSH